MAIDRTVHTSACTARAALSHLSELLTTVARLTTSYTILIETHFAHDAVTVSTEIVVAIGKQWAHAIVAFRSKFIRPAL